LGASASSSSALRLNFDGSSGVERSKERSSLHRRKEKKRKEKKKKKKTTPFKRSFQLVKEIINVITTFLGSKSRELGKSLEEVLLVCGCLWGCAVKIIIIIIIITAWKRWRASGRKRCGRRRRRRRRACEGRRTCTLEALQKVIHTPSCVLSRALFLLDLFERASKTLRKKRIRGTKGQG
jgi:hypothetical protein